MLLDHLFVKIIFMAAKRDSKLTKQLFRELPYNGINIVYTHGQLNINYLTITNTCEEVPRATP